MADTPQTLALITGAIAQNFRDIVVRTFNGRSMLLRTLPIVPGEGKNCAWDVEMTGAIGENFSDGADVSNYGSDDVQPATLAWGAYRSNFKVTDLARSAARTSRSPGGLVQLWSRNFMNSTIKLASTLNAALYTGAGTGTTIAGLETAIDDSNTYAGLSRGTYSGFRSSVFDPGSLTAPTFALLRSDLSAIYDASGEHPDLAFCPSAVWNKIANLFTETRRYVQPVTDVTTARGQVKLDASVSAFELDGCVFIKDKDATANRIYYLNSNHVRIEFLPQSDESELSESMMVQSFDDGYGALPLGMACVGLARTGAARKATCQVFAQLVVEDPSSCGVRKNVSTS